MAKEKKVFFCTECGNEFPAWLGQCPACKAWGTIEEAPRTASRPARRTPGTEHARKRPVSLREVDVREEARAGTGMTELDRVLGGGIVNGSLVLASGDPGIGKSTLLLQMCRNLAAGGRSVLYVSGEESLSQIKLRAMRIGECDERLKFLANYDIGEITEQILNTRPEVVVIDSVQTMQMPDFSGTPGGPVQIREITSHMMKVAKEENVTVFLVGHVTKEGAVAGPKLLEHMVDTVLYLEGDNRTSYRILRAVKNRFGSTNEIGVFEMCTDGLREVVNPSEYMLRGMPETEPGSVVAVTMEGTRPILVEVQALVNRTSFNLPRRMATGADLGRLNLLTAVIEKRTNLSLSQCDTYVNVAGGLRVTEPALDLPVVVAILSCFFNQPLGAHTVAFGEIGLIGELRSVAQPLARIREAAKLGYRRCLLSASDRDSIGNAAPKGIELVGIHNISELKQWFGK